MSTVKEEIQLAAAELSVLWKQIQHIECQGFPASDPIFDELAEQSWRLIHRLEILGHDFNRVDAMNIWVQEPGGDIELS